MRPAFSPFPRGSRKTRMSSTPKTEQALAIWPSLTVFSLSESCSSRTVSGKAIEQSLAGVMQHRLIVTPRKSGLLPVSIHPKAPLTILPPGDRSSPWLRGRR